MNSRLDIEERARVWGLREDGVEKDYVLGWLLWGIGADPVLSTRFDNDPRSGSQNGE